MEYNYQPTANATSPYFQQGYFPTGTEGLYPASTQGFAQPVQNFGYTAQAGQPFLFQDNRTKDVAYPAGFVQQQPAVFTQGFAQPVQYQGFAPKQQYYTTTTAGTQQPAASFAQPFTNFPRAPSSPAFYGGAAQQQYPFMVGGAHFGGGIDQGLANQNLCHCEGCEHPGEGFRAPMWLQPDGFQQQASTMPGGFQQIPRGPGYFGGPGPAMMLDNPTDPNRPVMPRLEDYGLDRNSGLMAVPKAGDGRGKAFSLDKKGMKV